MGATTYLAQCKVSLSDLPGPIRLFGKSRAMPTALPKERGTRSTRPPSCDVCAPWKLASGCPGRKNSLSPKGDGLTPGGPLPCFTLLPAFGHFCAINSDNKDIQAGKYVRRGRPGLKWQPDTPFPSYGSLRVTVLFPHL